MSAFLKSTLGVFVLSVAMFAGLGQSNEAQARPYGGYYGGYRAAITRTTLHVIHHIATITIVTTATVLITVGIMVTMAVPTAIIVTMAHETTSVSGQCELAGNYYYSITNEAGRGNHIPRPVFLIYIRRTLRLPTGVLPFVPRDKVTHHNGSICSVRSGCYCQQTPR